MTTAKKLSLVLLRVSLGILFLYAGLTKVIDPTWTAGGYLMGAKTFAGFFQWLASPGLIGFVNFLNAWGLTLLGVSLVVGIFVRLSSLLGAILMVLYYFTVLQFPYIAPHSFLVDDHIVYAAGLLVLYGFYAGRVWGLDNWFSNTQFCSRYPRLREWLS